MESYKIECENRRAKHSIQNNSSTVTTRITPPSNDPRAPCSEKASTSSSFSESILQTDQKRISKNDKSCENSSFESGMRCRNNNNKSCCSSSFTPLEQQCSDRPNPNHSENVGVCLCSPGGGQAPHKTRDSIYDEEETGKKHQQHGTLHERAATQQTQSTEQGQSCSEKTTKNITADNTVTSSSCYNDDDYLNNDNFTKRSNHRSHKMNYQQQHHNHHSSSSSYEHQQNTTQQNQTGHRRQLHHHHPHNHSRHKTQRNPAEMSPDSAVTPTVSKIRLHRPINDGENGSTMHSRFENPDYSRNNEEAVTNHSQNRDQSTRTDSTITSAFSYSGNNSLVNSHHPSKDSLFSSSQLIPSLTSFSPPRSPILADGPSLTKIPRLSIPLPEMTDIDSESVGASEAHINCLFPELLVMIFCYLDVRDKGRAAQVCVRWRNAAYTRTVWRGIEAKIHLLHSNTSIFRSLAKRGIRRIQILSLKRSIRDVVAGIPDLESLNLSGCYNITDSGLGQALLQRLLTVHELNLSLCKRITDYSLSRIAIYLKNLRVLHLGGCSVITNAGLFVISYGLVKLKTLDLRSCRDLSDQGIAHLAGLGDEVTNQGNLAHGLVKLKTLDLRICRDLSAHLAGLGDEVTNRGNLALEHLCLQDCQKLTDQALRYISLGLKNLTKVNLSFCGGVTDTGLQYLAKMPSLRKINLASCDQVTDAGLAHLARGGSRITSLDVSFCDKIGDWGLSCLAGGLFNLECLSLSACNISDNGISHIVQTMHGLTTLNIGQCHRITDRGLNLIADNLKKLSRMDLYGCTQISAKGLERIMQLPSLSSLNLGLWHKR